MLLHLITEADWMAASTAASYTPPSFPVEGFIHLSTPEQVHLPANRLFAGRPDVLVLCLDPGLLDAEVRWEQGVSGDSPSIRFPHLYGPLPRSAVYAVVPYRPGPGGDFTAPAGLPAPA